MYVCMYVWMDGWMDVYTCVCVILVFEKNKYQNFVSDLYEIAYIASRYTVLVSLIARFIGIGL